jgi:hypothetical protein
LAQHLAGLLGHNQVVSRPFILRRADGWQAAQDFLIAHDLRVCLYDLCPPYAASWHSLVVLKQALPSCHIVAVTLDRAALEAAVGPTTALAYGSTLYWEEARRIRAAVEAALRSVVEEQVSDREPIGQG